MIVQAYIQELIKIAMAPKQVRPGDIILVSGAPPSETNQNTRSRAERLFEEVVFRRASPATQGLFNHAGMYAGDGKVIEVLDKGPVFQNFDESVKNRSYTIIRPDTNKEIRAKAVEEMKGMIGKPYSATATVVGGLSLALPVGLSRLMTKLIPEDKDRFNCSGAIAEAYRRAGHTLQTVNPPTYTPPVDLANAADMSLVARKIRSEHKERLKERVYGRAAAMAREKLLLAKKRDIKKAAPDEEV